MIDYEFLKELIKEVDYKDHELAIEFAPDEATLISGDGGTMMEGNTTSECWQWYKDLLSNYDIKITLDIKR